MNEIYVVGLGPGKEEMMTGEAIWALDNADTIIGYTVYLGLLGGKYDSKELLSTPMMQEEKRCRMAFEEAMKGKKVAMICSGDAGIYGMAGIIYELAGEFPGVEIEVHPLSRHPVPPEHDQAAVADLPDHRADGLHQLVDDTPGLPDRCCQRPGHSAQIRQLRHAGTSSASLAAS